MQNSSFRWRLRQRSLHSWCRNRTNLKPPFRRSPLKCSHRQWRRCFQRLYSWPSRYRKLINSSLSFKRLLAEFYTFLILSELAWSAITRVIIRIRFVRLFSLKKSYWKLEKRGIWEVLFSRSDWFKDRSLCCF